MALSGIQIYKLLPASSKNAEVKQHANCKECGFPTCLAFAMKLGQKQAELSQCPYVEDEAKAQLEASAAPPIRLITISANGHKLEVGNETVLFRHEKSFYHQPGLFVRVKDNQSDAAEVAKAVGQYEVDYVGLGLRLDGLAVEAVGGDFAATVSAVKEAAPLPRAPCRCCGQLPRIIGRPWPSWPLNTKFHLSCAPRTAIWTCWHHWPSRSRRPVRKM
jgi:acetyl-CoA decarbonylase/synthase complex subunit gamma